MTEVLKDSTSHSPFFELVDSTTGLPKTAIVYTDVTASYCRSRGARVAITPATLASASAAYSSGGFILVDDANQPGVYRFDVPNAAFATGVEEVVVTIKATGCRTVSRAFTLTDISMQTAKVPATIAAGDIATDAITAASVKADAVTKIQAGLSTYAGGDTSGTTTLLTRIVGTLASGTHNPQTGDAYAYLGTNMGLLGANLTAADDAVIAAIAALNNLSQTQITGGAYALNSASFAFNSAMDFTPAQKAATLARVTLVDTTTTNTDMRGTNNAALATDLTAVAGYLDTEIAAILADTNELQTDWANGGRLDLILDATATQTSVNTIDDFLDTEIAAIKAVTDAIGATGSGLSAIPWNTSWDAEVQSECTDALNAYDPPTNAELTAALAGLNDVDTTEIVTAVLAGVVDTGVSVAKALEILAALAAGKVSAASAAGVTTLTYRKRDGSTTSFTVVVTESDKTRATTGSLA